MKFLTILAVLSATFQIHAQFTTIQQSVTNTFEFVEISESNNVALIGGIKLSKSTDDGFTWSEVSLGNFGLPWTTYVYYEAAIISSTTYCLIGLDQTNQRANVIRTSDGGASWSSVLETAVGSAEYFYDIECNGNVVVVGAEGGIQRSTNGGVTWTFISFSGIGYVTEVEYNEISGVWMAEQQYFNMRQSTDNGATWSDASITTPYVGLTRHMGTHDNNFTLMGTTGSSSGGIVELSDTYDFTDTIFFDNVSTQGIPIDKMYYLPSDDIIGQSFGYLCKLTQDGLMYFYDHNLIEAGGTNPVQIRDFELGQTYGIAVGMLGGVSRFDPTQSDTLYLPAEFSLQSTPCPGEMLTASMDFPYADSIQWYYDGQPVSNDPNLNYTTPNTFGQHTIYVDLWVGNNVETSNSVTVNFTPLLPSAEFEFIGDSTVCFDQSVFVNANYLTGPSGFGTRGVEVFENGISIYSATNYSSYGYWLTNVVDTTEIILVSSFAQECGTTLDSFAITIRPTDDLSDNFQLLPGDSLLCSGDQHILNVGNVDSTNAFLIESSQGWSGNFLAGNTGITTINGPNILNNWVPLDTNNQNFQVYFEITITDTNGCTQGPLRLDTAYVSRPDALPNLPISTYYLGDTVQVQNFFPAANPSWEVQSPLVLIGPNDFKPLVTSNISGYFDISLTNEPLPGCIDSATITIQFADSMNLDLAETCTLDSVASTFKIHNMKLDHEGNIYINGAYRATNTWNSPSYMFTKKAPNGDTLWQQVGPPISGVNRHKAVFTDFEIDANGDVYCLLSVNTQIFFNFELINIPSNPSPYSQCFLVKIDGQTGSWIWAEKINDHPAIANITLISTSDLLIDGNHLHISLGSTENAWFMTTDLNGNVQTLNRLSGGYLSRVSFLDYGTTNVTAKDCYVAPEFRKLPNGQIIIAGYLGNLNTLTFFYNSTPLTQLGTYPEGFFIANYDAVNGMTDITKLADVPAGMYNFNFDIDAEGDISVATSWEGNNGTIAILDSAIAIQEGSAIFQVDSNFDLKWITIGRYCRYPELDVVQSTGDVIVSGRSYRNMALQHEDAAFIMGDYPPVFPQYPPGPWDMFILSLNDEGEPLAGEWFHLYSSTNGVVNNTTFPMSKSQLHTTVTPCGDIYALFNRMNNSPTNWDFTMVRDGDTSQIESSLFYKFSEMCSPIECTYLAPINDLNICSSNADTLSVPLSQLFNVDSVSYNLLTNGSIIASDTITVSDTLRVATGQNSGPFEIQIYEPVFDTVFVNFYPVANPIYSYDSVICLGDSLEVEGLSGEYEYQWNNGTSFNSVYDFIPSNYTQGMNSLPVLIVDSMNCQSFDTLDISVTSVVTPTFASIYTLECGQDSLIVYNDSDYVTASWMLNGTPSSNLILSTELNSGTNNIIVTLQDTVCVQDFSIDVTIPDPVPSSYIFDTPICENLSQTLEAIPAINEFYWDNSSTASATFPFSGAQYGVGVHNIPVTAIDSNGCEANDIVSVQVVQSPLPTFNSSYTVNCGQDLLIVFNDGTYSQQVWTVNGSPSQNPITAAELNPGLNTVNVDLEDVFWFCNNSYEIIVDYCANSLSELNKANEISIQPNPTNGMVKIDPLVALGITKYVLSAANGQIVDAGTFNLAAPVDYTINAAPGTYFLSLEGDNRLYQFKLVKL